MSKVIKVSWLSILLVILLTSGCIQEKNAAFQFEIRDGLSVQPSTDKPYIVYNGENYDYRFPTIMDNRIFGTWENIATGERIELHRELLPNGSYESYIKTESAFYGFEWVATYVFIVYGPSIEFDTIFTVNGFLGDNIVITMELQGSSYTGTWKPVKEGRKT
ncbi:MAG: hypothetical protein EKK57_08355 [Proteobacteria bacterium]|nr:MAG: hypothetical protein EKK57_08355 [Pseudomonadota bacterium]